MPQLLLAQSLEYAAGTRASSSGSRPATGPCTVDFLNSRLDQKFFAAEQCAPSLWVATAMTVPEGEMSIGRCWLESSDSVNDSPGLLQELSDGTFGSTGTGGCSQSALHDVEVAATPRMAFG